MVNEHGVSRIVHHKDYYLRGGDMTVLVENHLYRIHSYFFERESLFFRQKLLAGPSEDGEDRGSSDSNHYTLDDVKSEDFSRFLWVFYNPKYSLYEASLDVWLSILRLATRWGFNNVKELSVRELEKLEIECVDKISIYHEYSISRLYLIPSYVSVVKRDKPLTFTEGVKLGMETVLRVADARERARQRASESGIRTPSFDDFEDSDVEVLVREVFGLGPPPTPTGASTIPNGSNPSTIKLNPAPKANGAAASRNGVSADTAAKTSVDSMRTFTTAMGSQVSTAQPTAAGPPSTTPAPLRQTTTAPEAPAAPATKPAASTTLTEKSVPPPPIPVADNKDKKVLPGNKLNVPETPVSANNPAPKSAGSGEPSSLVGQEPCLDKSSSIDKATFVTACEKNVDVSVTEMASRDQETKPDDAKEAKEYETPTTKTLDEKPEDSQLFKGTGTEDEKSSKRSEEDDTTKDADKEKLANHGEDQNKGADKEETAKDGDDQSIADSHAVFSDGEAKTKGPGGKGKRPNNTRGSKSTRGGGRK